VVGFRKVWIRPASDVQELSRSQRVTVVSAENLDAPLDHEEELVGVSV
jgi:hypothetical protein